VKSDKIEVIQALRGVAALIVVLRHCWEYVGDNIHSELGTTLFMPGGTMGVDLFFIVSGFIMVHTTWDQRGSANDVIGFFIKRFARIVPVYFLIMLIEVLVKHHGLHFFESVSNIKSLIKSMLFLPQGEIEHTPYYGDAPLKVGWTLNYEMYFYLIFGICMLFGRLRWFALATISVLTLIVYPYVTRGEFSTNVYGIYNFKPFYVNLITNPIIWLFMAGVVIGLIYRSKFEVRNVVVLRAAVLCSVSFAAWQYLSQYQMNHGIFLWGLSLVPMVLCFTLCDKAAPIRPPEILTYLGNISFSLYLVHISVLTVLSKLAAYFNAPFGGPSSYIAVTGASIAAAAVSHHYLEKRLSNVVRNWLQKKFLGFSVRRDIGTPVH